MFNKDFVWGAAAAAYQIEGAANEDGKGKSVWDAICKRAGAVREGHTGDVACDHYHRYKEDVQLMKEIGIKAYRFSISWPRVMPEGVGLINEKGLDFYNRLVDELLENGIEPWITLFHWDLPYELYKKGGWLNSESPDWFADYTEVVVRKLSDRVTNWMTINEPQCFVGNNSPVSAEFEKNPAETLQIMHNILLAHGKGVQAVRKNSSQPCKVCFVPVSFPGIPATKSEEDINAAREYTFSILPGKVPQSYTWWNDPVFFGKYPDDGVKLVEQHLPKIGQNDMEIISQPLDYFALNMYHGNTVRMGVDGNPETCDNTAGRAETAMQWPVTPEALYWGPKFLYERYKKPIIIAENGMANLDWVSLDGRVHDPQRTDFLNRYLVEYKKAAGDGVDLKGYFCWSIMDNFEWYLGYTKRFGLIHVDYETQKRTIKDSGYWYKKVIESNGLIL